MGFNWVDAFEKLADEQRGDPEMAFQPKYNPGMKYAGEGGMYWWVLQHTGDLINRAARTDNNGGGISWGMGAVGEKVDKLYREANREYGLERNVFEQINQTRKEFIEQGIIDESIPIEECINQVKKAGLIYANAYKKLTPYTKLQKQGQLAAIALGEMDWDFYRTVLSNMKRIVDLPEEEYKLQYLKLLPEYERLNENMNNLKMIDQLENCFDYMKDVRIGDTIFTPNDAHVILALYHKLNEKNANLYLSLTPTTMKTVAYLIYKQMDGNII